jgi:parallel beta-helix repeat protein
VSNDLSGVMITRGGQPVLRGNQIRDNEQCGVHAYGSALGTLEDNDIVENGICGVAIIASSLTIRRNRINGNALHAIRVTDGGKCTAVDNDLSGNLQGAWRIKDGCEPDVARARNLE